MKKEYILSLLSIIIALPILSSCGSESKETKDEWITLFNGNNFDGWKEYRSDSINQKWEIQDGIIMVSREGGDGVYQNSGFGRSIMTIETFDNFILELEFRLSKGANSGILYHVVEDSIYNQDYETAPEYQLLDDEFAISESLPRRQTASNYDMFAPDSTKTLNPAGEWNTAKIVYNNGRVEHWLNGQKVLEFTEESERWYNAYQQSKFPGDFPDWGEAKAGHISLQDHGDFVSFRNIRIRKL